jgi:ATP-dependent RNA helicase RhlE
LLAVLAAQGYDAPTAIQERAIPPIRAGSDLIGIAQTGTGKTAAFALPLLDRLHANPGRAAPKSARVLVLSPTRELAAQITASFKTYGQRTGVSVGAVFGGVGYKPQIQTLAKGLDILVATPGRLMDHIQQKAFTLNRVEVFVLDEADRMLDLGFAKTIRKIAAGLPAKLQNLFFSATMPPPIRKLANELLRSPVEVSVTPQATTADRLEQRVIRTSRAHKRAVLLNLLEDEAMTRTIVFTRTKRGADRVGRQLAVAGIPTGVIHGDRSQQQRVRAISDLKDGRIRVLVATDIAARGIDIEGVSHVVNFEFPDLPESYVHRIGRTARAGETGIAISLVDDEEFAELRHVERATRQAFTVEDRRDPKAEPAQIPRSVPAPNRARGQTPGKPQRKSRVHKTRPGDHAATPAKPAIDGASRSRRSSNRRPVARAAYKAG